MIKVIECPRDAMQGLKEFIPTAQKVAYLNSLLKVGFDTLDFGSFVSPKAIPQMRDTAEVLAGLQLTDTRTRLLAIVANTRGAEAAAEFDAISYLGYPFSISETFQQRNTNASIDESLQRVAEIQEVCVRKTKKLVLYISMGFGNPYGDPWNVDIVCKWVDKLVALDIDIFQLSDTIGVAGPDSISYLFSHLIPAYPSVEIGGHFHTLPHAWQEKIEAAYNSGCRRFDGALKGYGGCPMAKDDLTGNMPTEKMIAHLEKKEMLYLDMDALDRSMALAAAIFP
jgi:hydroxymethylglutaryl-CoA lyase